MNWCFLMQGEDRGRMQARVLQIIDRLTLTMCSFSSATLNGQVFLNFKIECEPEQAQRARALLKRLQGVTSVDLLSEADAMPRMIALFRFRCDITERNDLLNFISALGARVLVIRPLWLVFEIIGTPQEVEGVYQSTLGYGVVDQISASCIFVAPNYGVVRPSASAENDLTRLVSPEIPTATTPGLS